MYILHNAKISKKINKINHWLTMEVGRGGRFTHHFEKGSRLFQDHVMGDFFIVLVYTIPCIAMFVSFLVDGFKQNYYFLINQSMQGISRG